MPLDAAVASTLDTHDPDLSDEDELISALERDDDTTDPALSHLREQRLNQLHAEFTRAKVLHEASHGTYQVLTDEQKILGITTSTKYCVVHFRKDDFAKCRVMDARLAQLAPRHFDARFVAIDVTHAPFLVAKMDIRVLPCVFAFVDGIKTDRIVGFEGLGHDPEKFTLRDLEARLLSAGVLLRAKVDESDQVNRIHRQKVEVEDDDDDDWD